MSIFRVAPHAPHGGRDAVAALCALCCAAAHAAGTLQIDVQPREVVVGDPFRISVSASGIDTSSLPTPQFSNPGAAPLFSPQISSQNSFLNGRFFSSAKWTWTALPSVTGVVHFGEARLPIGGGRVLTGAVPDVAVIPPPPQPWVRIALHAPPSAVLSEEFAVRVEIAVQAATGTPFASDPLIPDEAPDISAPWLFGDGVGPAAAPALEPRPLAQALSAPPASSGHARGAGRTGFSLNRQISVRPTRELPTGNGSGKDDDDPGFVTYSFSVPFRAVAEGIAVFSPVRFSGHVVAVGDGDAPVRSPYIVALSETVQVRVEPPPPEGRPPGYGGIIGASVEARASLDAQTCRQGDPLELTLEIGGGAVRETVRAPAIFSDPALSAIFRSIGEPTRRESDSGVAFKWRVRPVVSGTLEVPPLALSWFDLPSHSYQTTRTAPLPLRVDPVAAFDPDALFADVAKEDDVMDGGAIAAASFRRLAPPALTFERGDPSGTDALAPPFGWIPTLAVPPALWLAAILWTPLRRRVAPRIAAMRRRAARKRAEARLRSADSDRTVAAATAAWLCAAGDRPAPRDCPPGENAHFGAGFGASELETALLRLGAAPDAAAQASSLLRRMEEAQFRPGADGRETVRANRAALADILHAALRTLPLALLAAGGIAFTPLRAEAAPPDPAQFRWRQALAAAATVSDADSALASAHEFADLASNRPTGATYRNLGALLLVAERPNLARDAFLRAEALEGRTPETDCGLALARDRLPTPRNPFRALAARHARLAPPRVRALVFTGTWTAAWILLAVCIMSGRRAKTPRALAPLAIPAALCMTAAIFTLCSLVASTRLLTAPIPELASASADAPSSAAPPPFSPPQPRTQP